MALRAHEPMELREDDVVVRFFPVVPTRRLMEDGTPIEDVRTCAHCGRTARFREAGPGGWAACTACGALG
jgi:hypothetical protein